MVSFSGCVNGTCVRVDDRDVTGIFERVLFTYGDEACVSVVLEGIVGFSHGAINGLPAPCSLILGLMCD